MRNFENFSKEGLRKAKADIERNVKAYHTAIFKNKDYIDETDKLRMITAYNTYKIVLKEILWEMEGRELGIIT